MLDTVGDWQELSALYEQADALESDELARWLVDLERQQHRQLPDLRRMLAARDYVARADFLQSLPGAVEARPGAVVRDRGEGELVGPYRLLGPLGSGGMADVWLAERVDGAFFRQVAIKLLFDHPSGPHRDSFAERFRRERDILARLAHSNIAALHDAGVTPRGQPWLALELVQGLPVTAWCDERRLDVAGRIAIFRQVLLAVEHAHSNLVIHRDLKPSNILVSTDGTVKLLDFGIAKLVAESQADTDLTRRHGRPMTLTYASPEQFNGAPLTTASDVYSLGIVLYELLAGATPFEPQKGSLARFEDAVLYVEPRPPSRVKIDAKHIDRDLDAIVLKAIAKTPDARYSSAEAMRRDLDRWAACDTVEARVPGAWYRADRFVRRHRLAVASTATAATLLVVFAVLALLSATRAREETRAAAAARDFMIGLFKVADPEKVDGNEPSARQVLETASERAGAALKEQPELLAQVLESIYHLQDNAGQLALAERTLDRLASAHRAAGDAPGLIRALVEGSYTAYRLDRPARAAALINQALEAAKTDAPDASLAARMLYVHAWALRGIGEVQRSEAEMKNAIVALETVHGHGSSEAIQAQRGLADLYGATVRYDEAIDRIEAALLTEGASSKATPEDRLELRIIRFSLYFQAGRYVRAKQLSEELRGDCAAVLGKTHSFCSFLLTLRARLYLRTDRLDQARGLLPELQAAALVPSALPSQVRARIEAARVMAASGDLAGYRSAREAVASVAVDPDNSPILRVSAAIALSECSLLMSEVTQARQWARVAYDLQAVRSWGQRGTSLILLGIASQRDGDDASALAFFERAEPELAAELGSDHPLIALFRLNQALSHQRLGHWREAERLRSVAMLKVRRAWGDESDQAPPFSATDAQRDAARSYFL